jgi:adenylate cyclase
VVDGLYLVTWPRATASKTLPDSQVRGWQWQFWNTERQVAAEFPIGRVYEPVRIGEAVMDNLRAVQRGMDLAMLAGNLRMLGAEDLTKWKQAMPELLATRPDDPAFAPRLAEVERLVAAAVKEAEGYLEMMAPPDLDLKTLAPAERDQILNLRDAAKTLPKLTTLVRDGLNQIAELRAQARERLGGKLVIVGWTATGAAADFVSTSIDPRTPGPHVHTAVANAVLTGFARRPAPAWADALAIIALGTLGTLVGIRATVVLAPIGAAVIIMGWFLLSGAVIWDHWWVITSVAGPGVAAAAGVGVVILHRLLVEQRSRRKTEERFKSYLSPAVVDILVNNPELDSMKPWRKTLSIMFTDLAGFTTTAERLGGDRTAEVLAKFLGGMTEIVQSTGATLDKYIGDAIMAFWGAPIDDEQHARNACRAAVKMIQTLDRQNARGDFGDAGTLVMRVGIASGEVMVGDFGNPPRNSSYTVIGDTANLASRLEGANKAFGSRILVSQATRELAGDGEFLFRLIGDVKVKGRIGATRLFELIAGEPKGPRTAEWVALTETMVNEFRARRFAECLEAADRLERDFGDETLAGLYREEVRLWSGEDAPDSPFDGTITLNEK